MVIISGGLTIKTFKKLAPDNYETISNNYVIRCMNITVIIMLVIWILNATEVFPFNKKTMIQCMTPSLIIYVIGMLCWFLIGTHHKIMKYFIILWTVVITAIMATGLTYHAILASVLPILFCSLYSSRRLMIYTTVLTILSTFVIVLVGYQVGICDANMALLPGEPLSEYADNGYFTRIALNDKPIFNLILFFVFPRCLVYTMCLVVCFNIGKLNRSKVTYAHQMEELAVKDGMTGLYNKSKYLKMITDYYPQCDKVAVIFWDINNLKITNDTIGHEAGDSLIRTVANSIQQLTSKSSNAFRIGGDEFVMITDNAKEDTVNNILTDWNNIITEISASYPYEISASVGSSYGPGHQIDDLIKEADHNMYLEKRKFHNK